VNIFVGNLDYRTTEDQLQAAFALFAQYGSVDRVNIVTDRDTRQPRGFAFVEMADSREAKTAIDRLNGFEINGRAMNVPPKSGFCESPRDRACSVCWIGKPGGAVHERS